MNAMSRSWFLPALLVGALALFGCGDSGSDANNGTNNANNGNNGGPNNGGPNNGGPNNGNNGGPNNGGPNNGDPNNGGPNNGDPNNGDPNNGGPNNGGPNNGNNGGVLSCDVVPSGSYTPADGDACNVVAQDCTDGDGCYFGEAGADCFPAGDVKCGDACVNANDCRAGTLCVDNPGRCLPFCELGEPCPGDAQCAGLQGRDDVGVCSLPVQGTSCDVLAPDCPEGEACYVVSANEECTPPSGANAGDGEACEFANDCAPGLLCVQGEDTGLICLKACPTDGSVMCESGPCAALDGLDGVGVCVPN